jgi:DNA (cytosine-5)-methyltransferase 1
VKNSIDIYSGAGGLTEGLSRAQFETVRAVEFDADAAATFAAAHPDVDLVHAPIEDVDFRDLAGEIDLLAAGPPCQPFSSGGKQLAVLDPRNGFPQLLRAIQEVRPTVVLVENVVGLTLGVMRPYLDELVADLGRLGYSISWKVLDAADFGVCQRRRRVFIVGSRDDEFAFPEPTHGPGRALPWIPAGSVLSRTTMVGEPNHSIVTYAKNPDIRPSPYDGHLFNGGGRPIDLSKPARTVLASAGGNKTHFVDTLQTVEPYHRHLQAGGKPRRGEAEGMRRITVSESAMLQSFPAAYPFAGSRSSQYRQVGNAVPPDLAKAVARQVMCHLDGIESRPTTEAI